MISFFFFVFFFFILAFCAQHIYWVYSCAWCTMYRQACGHNNNTAHHEIASKKPMFIYLLLHVGLVLADTAAGTSSRWPILIKRFVSTCNRLKLAERERERDSGTETKRIALKKHFYLLVNRPYGIRFYEQICNITLLECIQREGKGHTHNIFVPLR